MSCQRFKRNIQTVQEKESKGKEIHTYIYAILKNGKKEYIGEIRAYNFETLWLDTIDEEDIQSPKEWWENINGSAELNA
jgi:hypothetical protein